GVSGRLICDESFILELDFGKLRYSGVFWVFEEQTLRSPVRPNEKEVQALSNSVDARLWTCLLLPCDVATCWKQRTGKRGRIWPVSREQSSLYNVVNWCAAYFAYLNEA
ncbi:unnamed protein product, partial [Ectocarpus sp. 12 AP-2014]